MSKLILVVMLFSSALSAEGMKKGENHNHHKLWIEVGVISAVVGTYLLTQYLINKPEGNQMKMTIPTINRNLIPHMGVTTSRDIFYQFTSPVIPIPPPTTEQSIQTLCSMGFCK